MWKAEVARSVRRTSRLANKITNNMGVEVKSNRISAFSENAFSPSKSSIILIACFALTSFPSFTFLRACERLILFDFQPKWHHRSSIHCSFKERIILMGVRGGSTLDQISSSSLFWKSVIISRGASIPPSSPKDFTWRQLGVSINCVGRSPPNPSNGRVSTAKNACAWYTPGMGPNLRSCLIFTQKFSFDTWIFLVVSQKMSFRFEMNKSHSTFQVVLVKIDFNT